MKMETEIANLFMETAKVRRAYKTYHPSPDKTPYSKRFYVGLINKYTGKNYKPVELTDPKIWTPKNFKGQVILKEDSAESILPPLKSVQQPSGVTQCERNFAIIKEATHLLLANPDVKVKKLSNLVTSIVTAGPSVILSELSPLLQDEYLGEFAALELLLPWSDREECAKQFHKKKLSALDIAEKFKIPEKIVVDFLNEKTHNELKKYREALFDHFDDHYGMFEIPPEIQLTENEIKELTKPINK